MLQVVPVVSSAIVNGSGNVGLNGLGFVEAHGSVYTVANTSVTDTSASTGPDVNSGNNDRVNLPSLVPFGVGSLTVATEGGTSAPMPLNAFSPALGGLYGLALQSTGAVWLGTSGLLYKINPATGLPTVSVNAPGGTGSYFGLQVLPAGLTLAGVSVPQGSLLVDNGQLNPDKIFALNPTTGAIVATLTLPSSLDAISGIYDARATACLCSTIRRASTAR